MYDKTKKRKSSHLFFYAAMIFNIFAVDHCLLSLSLSLSLSLGTSGGLTRHSSELSIAAGNYKYDFFSCMSTPLSVLLAHDQFPPLFLSRCRSMIFSARPVEIHRSSNVLLYHAG